MGKADLTDNFEPLFDYRRVQPANVICFDDDDADTPLTTSPKRKKNANVVVDENGHEDVKLKKVAKGVEKEDEEDWLPPPPTMRSNGLSKISEDSTIKQLRLKKLELASLAESADVVMQAVEESVKRELSNPVQASIGNSTDKLSKPSIEKAKILISIQGEDELKHFRVFTNDKFERMFKIYADKVKLDLQRLVFSFDGEKISPTATPEALGMEDDDIIEVHVKQS